MHSTKSLCSSGTTIRIILSVAILFIVASASAQQVNYSAFTAGIDYAIRSRSTKEVHNRVNFTVGYNVKISKYFFAGPQLIFNPMSFTADNKSTSNLNLGVNGGINLSNIVYYDILNKKELADADFTYSFFAGVPLLQPGNGYKHLMRYQHNLSISSYHVYDGKLAFTYKFDYFIMKKDSLKLSQKFTNLGLNAILKKED